MPDSPQRPKWGTPPWTVDFHPEPRSLPDAVDFAVVGGGFSGTAAAAWLAKHAPEKRVALFESSAIGAGASGHTGGIALAETAVGDLPGLGDVLQGLQQILGELRVECDLALDGAWELARKGARPDSPIGWSDSGKLGVINEVPGGTIDPGKMVSGLARAAEGAGAMIFEEARVEDISFGEPLRLRVRGREVRAERALIATNAMSLELSGLEDRTEPRLTLALATAPLEAAKLATLGLAAPKPFYTIDYHNPYLWGRMLGGNRVIFGSGLVHADDWRDLLKIDVGAGEAAETMARLERRVRGLDPLLKDVEITHRWGGPILIGEEWKPIFSAHRRSPRAIVQGAFSGHGVALSVYLGRWAAEVMLGRRELPRW